MKIIIDCREKKLFDIIHPRVKCLEEYEVLSQQLDIGDIHIIDNDSHIILERKTIDDLVSSISDGRYKEQSFRLQSTSIHNHNIFYIIEGNIKNFKPYKSHIKQSAIYSSLFTLSYYKGFSVYRTDDIYETSEYIIRISDKLYRENRSGKRKAFFNNKEIITAPQDYTTTLKSQKKSFITKENIAKIMLMQIPNVSNNFAEIITIKYKTIIDLICALQEDNKCLDNITYNTSNGKSRKISKTCIENIKEYLMNDN